MHSRMGASALVIVCDFTWLHHVGAASPLPNGANVHGSKGVCMWNHTMSKTIGAPMRMLRGNISVQYTCLIDTYLRPCPRKCMQLYIYTHKSKYV